MNTCSPGCTFLVLSNNFLRNFAYYRIAVGWNIHQFGSCSRFPIFLFGSWYHGKPLNKKFVVKCCRSLYIGFSIKFLIVIAILYYFVLPAVQVPVLQSWVCSESPAQSAPPLEGAGLLHILVLAAFPPPHVLVQADQAPHSLHWPSTEPLSTNIKKGCLRY